jgi:hypothetical protein
MREETISKTPETRSEGCKDITWSREPARWLRTSRNRVLQQSLSEERERKVLPLIRNEAPAYPSLVARLRERKVVQWFLAYLAVAFLVLQVMEILAEAWSIPIPFQRGLSLGMGLGTLPALVVAWYHGELGRQRVCCTEVGIIGILLTGTIVAVCKVSGL